MGALMCCDIFCSNRFFMANRGKRPGGVQSVRICHCLIKGSNFLFISDPHPPNQSSCLLIPPLQTAPIPHPGPPCWCPARLCFSLLHSRAKGLEAICFVSAGSQLSTNKSSLSRTGVVTEEEVRVWGVSLSGFYSNPGTHRPGREQGKQRETNIVPGPKPKSILTWLVNTTTRKKQTLSVLQVTLVLPNNQ